MKLYYRIGTNKATKLSKEPIFFETDNQIEVIFDVPIKYRTKQMIATIEINGKRTDKIVKDYKIKLDNFTKFTTVKIYLKSSLDDKIWICDEFEVISLAKQTKNLSFAVPEFMRLPIEVKRQQILINKLITKNNLQAEAIETLNNRIKLVEGAYSPDEI